MTQTDATPWSAVVLGGGDPGDPFAAAHGVKVKPLIPVAGEPMALHVLRALRGSGRVGRVAYVGPTTPELDDLIDERVTDHGTLLSNLEAGVDALRAAGLQPGERVLVVTADVPMLRAGEVRSVLDAAPAGAGLVYPVVRREVCEAAYPGVKRTYARLRDGTFTGGNLFLLDPALIGQFLPRLREVLAARKAPLKLAGLIGPGVLLRLVTGRLSVAALEAKVSALLGVPARALITPHAAVGTDVDKDEDLTLAEAQLTGRPGVPGPAGI
ncbi:MULTISPECIES: NTP transferase domain-containing protein [unclassified Deinococcus]|uniref:NTP transferase domain-containing protein n=1 Tax=unclassified Deinococcus TaxID=2623546 RepID=UPI000991D21E|nr:MULTISPECIES: NTP transferase domain-containing protein [unclassified Deinococcus]MBX8465495.1 NTP transferase domain-containing protein [Deinococcus sp. RIT780]MCD0169419.1 nucleotidyltransferase family protein [Deinococcus sp. 23YEL01]OOV14556.1 nucleotide-diphospho-sugar transferase [Deinococcus sp. LM3]